MERIVEYAKRVDQLYNLKKQEIKANYEEEAKELVNLVLQMFEAGIKEDDMFFNELTIGTDFGYFTFSFEVNSKTYCKESVSEYDHISKVADKICSIMFDSKLLKKAEDLYLEMAEKIPSYYISEEDYNHREDLISVTFGIGKLG